jgi:hypothetical protein
VLWCAVRAVQELRPDLPCAVYTSDADATPDALAARALDRFSVRLLRPPQVRHRLIGRGFLLCKYNKGREKMDLGSSSCLSSCRVASIQLKWLMLVQQISHALLISVEHCAALEILSISGPAYSLY